MSSERCSRWADSRHAERRWDAGSVMPLVLGMVLCIGLLGAGVMATTSTFTARSNLQHLCDGAAAAASEAAQFVTLTAGTGGSATAQQVAQDYLAARSAPAAVDAAVDSTSVQLTCRAEAPVMFGALFGSPNINLTVNAVGRTVLP